MSISLDDLSFIININNISKQINRYIPIILLLFGIIGNLISCLVFTQRILRTNSCTNYFLAASLSNLIFLTTILSPMLGTWNDEFNLISTISVLCKFTMFIILTTRTLALWFIVLATIDRYLISSYYIYRQQVNSIKHTYYWIIIICIISILIWAETIYCFDANLLDSPIKCYTKSDFCRLYNDMALAFITIIISSILMLIFGLLTIFNIRRSKKRIRPNINTIIISIGINRNIVQVLTRMLLIQVILVVFLNLPHAIYICYLTITFYKLKTPVQVVMNGFIFNTLLLLPFLSNSISFLLYTLSEKIFRETLIQLGKKFLRYLKFNILKERFLALSI